MTDLVPGWSLVTCETKTLRQCAVFPGCPKSKRYGAEKDVGGTWEIKSWKTHVCLKWLNMNNKLLFLIKTCLYSKFNSLAITCLPLNRCVIFSCTCFMTNRPWRRNKLLTESGKEIQSREFPMPTTTIQQCIDQCKFQWNVQTPDKALWHRDILPKISLDDW